MTEQQIRTAISDCDQVMSEAEKAINGPAATTELSAKKQMADAINRGAIATAIGAKSILGVQLESVLLRQGMQQAYEQGGVADPSELTDKIQNG